MADQNCFPCGQSPLSYAPKPLTPCPSTPKTCQEVDASCVAYTGPNLTCSDIKSPTDLESLIQALDVKLCEIGSLDWSSFNYHCLDDDEVITTPGEFVSSITSKLCTLETSFDTFTTVTYPNGLNNLQTQINTITNPALTLCPATGIVPSDNYISIFTKLANKICEFEPIDVSTANWNSCSFITTPLPVTVVEGFDTILDILCSFQTPPTVQLPTFNNQGSCLVNQGTADTLVATINGIKNRLCQTGTYTYKSNLWTCLTPADQSLQATLDTLTQQAQINKANTLTFEPTQFELVDNGCDGKVVSLIGGGGSSTDRFVASDGLDMSPGTLADKLQAGTNTSLDNTTNPGKIIINSTQSPDEKVKVNSSDTTAGFLNDKLSGGANQGITIDKTVNVLNNNIAFTPNVDFIQFTNNLFDAIEANPDLYTRFCTLICACRPCNDPSGGTGNKVLLPLEEFLTVGTNTVYYIPALAGDVRLIYSAIEGTVLNTITLSNGTVTIPSGYAEGSRVQIIAERTTP